MENKSRLSIQISLKKKKNYRTFMRACQTHLMRIFTGARIQV